MSLLPRVDPLDLAISHRVRVDEETGDLVVRRTQDVSAILDRNKERQNSGNTSYRTDEMGLHLHASIPNIVIEKWLQEEGVNVWLAKVSRRTGRPNWHMRQVLRKLEDPDWKHLKTTTMKWRA